MGAGQRRMAACRRAAVPPRTAASASGSRPQLRTCSTTVVARMQVFGVSVPSSSLWASAAARAGGMSTSSRTHRRDVGVHVVVLLEEVERGGRCPVPAMGDHDPGLRVPAGHLVDRAQLVDLGHPVDAVPGVHHDRQADRLDVVPHRVEPRVGGSVVADGAVELEHAAPVVLDRGAHDGHRIVVGRVHRAAGHHLEAGVERGGRGDRRRGRVERVGHVRLVHVRQVPDPGDALDEQHLLDRAVVDGVRELHEPAGLEEVPHLDGQPIGQQVDVAVDHEGPPRAGSPAPRPSSSATSFFGAIAR